MLYLELTVSMLCYTKGRSRTMASTMEWPPLSLAFLGLSPKFPLINQSPAVTQMIVIFVVQSSGEKERESMASSN